jgi:hypothetical protein
MTGLEIELFRASYLENRSGSWDMSKKPTIQPGSWDMSKKLTIQL